MEKATFAAGCFWGVEALFRAVPGVSEAICGYSGGHTAHPTYKEVCGDATGHAEAVEVSYDPAVISYDGLLDVFFGGHNPTTRNEQGVDKGTQYRSVIFCHSTDQEMAARAKVTALTEAKTFKKPIVTEIIPAQTFWVAEDYHQRYFEKHPDEQVCHIGGH